jgi:hypothetical protein
LETSFLEKIDAWVLRCLSQGATSFRELLAELPGVYPAEVLCSLRRLRRNSLISELDVLAIELEAASIPVLQREPVAPGKRFIEHPLDFEWRFTRQGVERICGEIEKRKLKPQAEVLCLGCPSIFLFGRQHFKNLTFRLWDKNTPIIGQMEEVRDICRVDITLTMPPHHAADIIVVDPPWYNEFYRLFIWAGFHCLASGGRIILSFPPEGTRPSVEDDFNSLIKWISQYGLKLESRQPNCLPYRSPLFEVNALRAQGVSNFPLNWRRGDLLILSKQKMTPFPKPSCQFPAEKWEEIGLRTSRIKINREKKCGGSIFRSVGGPEILPSVSSRYRLRGLANVVTSGNRFIRTSAPDAFFDCLAAAEASGPDRMTKTFLASRHPLLMRKVLDLISKEEKEAAQYFQRIHEF